MLLSHLPPDSATVRSIAGEPGWTVTDYLLATVIDTIAVSNWLFVSANSGKKGGRSPQPKPVPRFGEKAAEAQPTREISSEDLAGFFGGGMNVVRKGA